MPARLMPGNLQDAGQIGETSSPASPLILSLLLTLILLLAKSTNPPDPLSYLTSLVFLEQSNILFKKYYSISPLNLLVGYLTLQILR
jgi:hypothetical protein